MLSWVTRGILLAAVLLVLSGVIASPASATSFNIPVLPPGDAVYSFYQDQYGSSEGWNPNASPNLNNFWINEQLVQGGSNRTFMQFDVRNLVGYTIDSATINLRTYGAWSGYSGGIAGYLYYYGIDPAATGDATQGLMGGIWAYTFTTDNTPDGWLGIDVSSWMAGDITNSGWAAFNTESIGNDANAGFTFGSADGGLAPFLAIEAHLIPAPPTLLLLGSGLLGLAGWRKLRKG